MKKTTTETAQSYALIQSVALKTNEKASTFTIETIETDGSTKKQNFYFKNLSLNPERLALRTTEINETHELERGQKFWGFIKWSINNNHIEKINLFLNN